MPSMSIKDGGPLKAPVILDDVTVSFGGRAALDGLSLSFKRGVCTMVVGGSGSGKSLTLKAAAGLIVPDEGTVYFEGRPIFSMGDGEYQKMQARTGFHFQDAALWANKSLKENLSLPLLAADPTLSEEWINTRIAEAFSSVGLDSDPSLRPASISTGQRKMVSFLRAVITEPEILFLDDPDSFLDMGSLRQLLARVMDLKERGVTIVVATNNKMIGEVLADTVAVLTDGRILAEGPYADIMETDDPVIAPILRHLA